MAAVPPQLLPPGQVLSRCVRRTFLAALSHAVAHGVGGFHGKCQALAAPLAWRQFVATLRQTEGVVYAKRPLAGPQQILHSLARYTHRVAISNRRFLACEDGTEAFRWKDYQRGNRQRTLTLDAVEFASFPLPVLPRGFQRLRHYGFLANGLRQAKLPLCRWVLGHAGLPAEDVSPARASALAASRPRRSSDACPACHVGRMQGRETWFPQARDVSRPLLVVDTS